MTNISIKYYRPSSYNIFVQVDKEKESYLLVHGYTGAIDHLSGNLVKLIRSIKKPQNEKELISNGFEKQLLNTLLNRGYFTELSVSEELQYTSKLANGLHEKARKSASYMFLVAYDCNFRCPYCYENDISSYGKGWSKKKLTTELIDKAYGAILDVDKHLASSSKVITLYGGEPLLSENYDVVSYIIDKGQQLGFSFKAITNGYDVDHFMDLMGKGLIEEVQITIDGTKEFNNKRRVYKDSTVDTFSVIMANIQTLLDKNIEVSIRINTDANNFQEIEKL